MRIFKTLRTAPPTYSTDESNISFKAPRSWKEMTQEQLRYTLFLLATFPERVAVKTYMLIRFCGIHVVKKDRFGWQCFIRRRWKPRLFFTLKTWQIEDMIRQFDYIDSYENMDVRLVRAGGLYAVDSRLHGVRFFDYLQAEKYYQAYIVNMEDRFLEKLALVLYRRESRKIEQNANFTEAELLGTYLWYSHVKVVLSDNFPNFFKKVDVRDGDSFDMMKSINTQIRALTDGDVTKEEEIYNIDCWRALTELDSKAREAEEYNRLYKKK